MFLQPLRIQALGRIQPDPEEDQWPWAVGLGQEGPPSLVAQGQDTCGKAGPPPSGRQAEGQQDLQAPSSTGTAGGGPEGSILSAFIF